MQRVLRMIMRKQSRLVLLLAVVLALAAPCGASPEHTIDLNTLVAELHKASPATDRLGLILWLPEQYWRVVTDGSEEVVNLLRPYVVIAAVNGKLGPFGGATFVDAGTLAGSITLVSGAGERFSPLKEDQVSPDARSFMATMKPNLTRQMGEMGKHLQIFFFPANTPKGDPIADAAAPGEFTVELGDEVFHWRLPLGSVLPPKICPVDGERMSGAWTYCPWHGKKLRELTEQEKKNEGIKKTDN